MLLNSFGSSSNKRLLLDLLESLSKGSLSRELLALILEDTSNKELLLIVIL